MTTFNAQAIESEYGDEWDIVADTYDILKQQTPQRLTLLESAIADSNFGEIKLQAHTVKGSFRIFFAEKLITLSATLETLGHEQKDLSDADNLMAELRDEFEKFLGEFTVFITGKVNAAWF